MGSKIAINGKEYSIGGGGGTDFTTDDTLSLNEDNVLSVKMPVQGVISEEDFDALDSDEKKRGLYFIPGDENEETLSVEEYDTTVDGCIWHVRKWSNGYVELSGNKTYTGITLSSGEGSVVYTSQALDGPLFPFPLTEVYTNIATPNKTVSSQLSAMTWPASTSLANQLKRGVTFTLTRFSAATPTTSRICFTVTGRWR